MRTLYIFDPSRTAILLIGGDKTGNDRWYEQFVPVADGICGQYLKEIRKEGIDCECERMFEMFAHGFEVIRKRLQDIEATPLSQLHSPLRARLLRAALASQGKL